MPETQEETLVERFNREDRDTQEFNTLHARAIGSVTGERRLVPLEELYESPWNPRQHFPEEAMKELVESMKAGGFREWLPLMVRPRAEGGYEIGAGHRRRKAAELAGIAEVPCIIRSLSDEEFLDVLNFDNSGREDVHPMHEAAGWRHWMERTGKGVLDIAAKIGKSKEYVYQRLKYAALIEPAAAAFLDGKITARHAILIARLQPKEQEKALKFALEEDWRGNRPGVRALADHLHETYIDLVDECPFDRSDRSLLAGAGNCEECPKRAANIPGFEFQAVDPEFPDDPREDLCTDPACFRQKVDNHLIQIRRALESSGEQPISISPNWQKPKKGALKSGEYDLVKDDAKGAKTALLVEGPEAGKVVKIKIRPKQQSSSGGSRQSEEDRKRAEEERKVRVERELGIRRKILQTITDKVDGLQRADLQALLVESIDRKGVELCRLHDLDYKGNLWDAGHFVVEALPKMPEAELFRLAVEVPVMGNFDEWAISRDEKPEALLELAKRYKVDAAKIRIQEEEKLKSQEGTRKEVVSKLPTLDQKPAAKKAAAKKAPAKKASKPVAKKKAAKK